jgi:hypothetical protein
MFVCPPQTIFAERSNHYVDSSYERNVLERNAYFPCVGNSDILYASFGCTEIFKFYVSVPSLLLE